MSDFDIDQVMIDFGRNLPEWIKNGIGEKLDNMVKSLDKIEEYQSKKFKEKHKEIEKSQNNQLKTATEITKFSKEQLESLNKSVKSINNLNKQFDKVVEQEKKRENILKSTKKFYDKEIESKKNFLKENEKLTRSLSDSINKVDKNVRNIKTMSESVFSSLQSNNYTNAIDRVGDTASDLADEFGSLGKVVGFGILGLSQLAQITVSHAQKLQTTFSELNQKGLFLGNNFTKFSETANEASMTMDQLGKIVGNNVSNIVMLGKEGLSMVAQVNKNMRENDSLFRKLGMSTNEIIEFQAQNLQYERTLGMRRNLTEKQRGIQLERQLSKFTSLSAIMGKSVQEIQDTSKAAVEKPEAQANLMQATRGMDKEERRKIQQQARNAADTMAGMGFSQEMIDKALSIQAVQIGKRTGNAVTSRSAIRAQAEMSSLSPALLQMLSGIFKNSMTDTTGMTKEQIIDHQKQVAVNAVEKLHQSRDEVSEGPLALMISNGITGGLENANTIFETAVKARQLDADSISENFDNLADINNNPISDALQAMLDLENARNKLFAKLEETMNTVITAFEKNGTFGTVSNALVSISEKLENINPEDGLIGNLENFFGKDSKIVSTMNTLTGAIEVLSNNIGKILLAWGGLKILGGGSALFGGWKAGKGLFNLGKKGLGKLFGFGAGSAGAGTAAGAAGAGVAGKAGRFLLKRGIPFLSAVLPDQMGDGTLSDDLQNYEFTGSEQESMMRDVYPDFEKRKEKAINDLKRYKKTGKGNISSILDTLEELVGTDGINKILQDNGMGGIKGNNDDNFEGSAMGDFLGGENINTSLATQISEKFIELVFPKFTHLQNVLIKSMFSENKEVLDKIFTKSLDKYLFSKDDVKQSILRKGTDLDTDMEKSTRGVMTAMGLGVGGSLSNIRSRNSTSSSNYSVTGNDYNGGLLPEGSDLAGASKDDLIAATYNAFRKQGLSHQGALVMVGEVGRENAYKPQFMFGHHVDAANNKRNSGMISWQGSRSVNLMEILNEKGLIKNGRIVPSQEAIDAQAQFLIEEMQGMHGEEDLSHIYEMLTDPNVDPNQAMDTVGRKFIRWAIDNSKYRNDGLRNRRDFYNRGMRVVSSRGKSDSNNNSDSRATSQLMTGHLKTVIGSPTGGTRLFHHKLQSGRSDSHGSTYKDYSQGVRPVWKTLPSGLKVGKNTSEEFGDFYITKIESENGTFYTTTDFLIDKNGNYIRASGASASSIVDELDGQLPNLSQATAIKNNADITRNLDAVGVPTSDNQDELIRKHNRRLRGGGSSNNTNTNTNNVTVSSKGTTITRPQARPQERDTRGNFGGLLERGVSRMQEKLGGADFGGLLERGVSRMQEKLGGADFGGVLGKGVSRMQEKLGGADFDGVLGKGVSRMQEKLGGADFDGVLGKGVSRMQEALGSNPFLNNPSSFIKDRLPLNDFPIDNLIPSSMPIGGERSSSSGGDSDSSGRGNVDIVSEVRKLNTNMGRATGFIFP